MPTEQQDRGRHTPGPWVEDAGHIYSTTGFHVCDPRCEPSGFDDEMEANARLIAAAPSMYTALRAIVALNNRANVHERWEVRIGDAVDSRYDSRQNARKRIDALRAAALALVGKGA